MTIKVKVCRCPACGDDIYSRAQHDFRACTCGAIFVDGGFEPYAPRYGFLIETRLGMKSIYIQELEISADKRILFDDYNSGTDRFGKITAEERYHKWVQSKEAVDGQGTHERQ